MAEKETCPFLLSFRTGHPSATMKCPRSVAPAPAPSRRERAPMSLAIAMFPPSLSLSLSTLPRAKVHCGFARVLISEGDETRVIDASIFRAARR